jgi:hypothetical protein
MQCRISAVVFQLPSKQNEGEIMNLAKALKRKNTLAGEIAQLKARLGEQNVRAEGQEFDYDNAAVLAELNARVAEIVAVKTALARANADAYASIFRLAELKGLLVTLRGLNTKHGEFYEGHGFGQEPVKIKYRAQIAKAEADRLAAQIEAEIETLQDTLDSYNANHQVE